MILTPAYSIVYDQLDFYSPIGSINRLSGITVGQLTLNLFINNQLLTWPIIDGSLIYDSSISSGSVYFNEIIGSNGYYSIRLFTDRVGSWRLIFRNSGLGVEIIKEYDVVPSDYMKSPIEGLNASFDG